MTDGSDACITVNLLNVYSLYSQSTHIAWIQMDGCRVMHRMNRGTEAATKILPLLSTTMSVSWTPHVDRRTWLLLCCWLGCCVRCHVHSHCFIRHMERWHRLHYYTRTHFLWMIAIIPIITERCKMLADRQSTCALHVFRMAPFLSFLFLSFESFIN